MLTAGINNMPINGADAFSLNDDFMTMRSVGLSRELTRHDKRSARAARYMREAEVAEASRTVALADLLALIFETTDIETVLDGEVLLDGTGADLEQYLFGPVYYNEPIVYAEPQPRGPDLNATAALWVMGIGSVYRPLPAGAHTLVSTVDSAFFGFMQFTYHITVTP